MLRNIFLFVMAAHRTFFLAAISHFQIRLLPEPIGHAVSHGIQRRTGIAAALQLFHIEKSEERAAEVGDVASGIG